MGVNVQHSSILDGYPFNCTYEWMIDCEIHQLPGGDRVRTYTARCRRPRATGCGWWRSSSPPGATSGWSPRRPTASSCRTTSGTSPAPEPVLSSDQLADVVSQDWWGFKLPARFAEEGKELNPYEEIEGSL